jgi:hypothetical protein
MFSSVVCFGYMIVYVAVAAPAFVDISCGIGAYKLSFRLGLVADFKHSEELVVEAICQR